MRCRGMRQRGKTSRFPLNSAYSSLAKPLRPMISRPPTVPITVAFAPRNKRSQPWRAAAADAPIRSAVARWPCDGPEPPSLSAKNKPTVREGAASRRGGPDVNSGPLVLQRAHADKPHRRAHNRLAIAAASSASFFCRRILRLHISRRHHARFMAKLDQLARPNGAPTRWPRAPQRRRAAKQKTPAAYCASSPWRSQHAPTHQRHELERRAWPARAQRS